jgi:hypothetical protein
MWRNGSNEWRRPLSGPDRSGRATSSAAMSLRMEGGNALTGGVRIIERVSRGLDADSSE